MSGTATRKWCDRRRLLDKYRIAIAVGIWDRLPRSEEGLLHHDLLEAWRRAVVEGREDCVQNCSVVHWNERREKQGVERALLARICIPF